MVQQQMFLIGLICIVAFVTTKASHCTDINGNIRQNFETWLNGSCVECACVYGSINCTKYFVEITHGLYKVSASPTCELCGIQIQTGPFLSACKAFLDNRAKLTKCESQGFHIRDSHVCNGIEECPDGSDETNCANALQNITDQMRGNVTLCSNGRQVESFSRNCKNASNCSQNLRIQNCVSELTCQDEDGLQYFEGASWSAGACMQCSCKRGSIHCSRKIVLEKFLELIPLQNRRKSGKSFTERCNQPECNVARYTEKNADVCHACKWNGKLHYYGDRWKENGVDFFCASGSNESQRVRPGCYVKNERVKCTGAIPGIRQLSLLSNDKLFLCDSGDEIRPISARCNIQRDCNDSSDERNCEKYYCPYVMSYGFLWNRTQLGKQVLKQCSLVDPTWTGTFESNCTKNIFRTIWKHNTSCTCENKILLEYFKSKNEELNTTNFLNVSEELASAGRAIRFTNPKVFHDMNKELFKVITSRFLSPLTLQNADTALRYCRSFIDTITGSPQYRIKNTFCKAKLADERNILAREAVDFLRQAPNGTEAHRVGWTLSIWPVLEQNV
ncbi:low-density lipoprotein receptor-related protein 4-like isoform X1 [Montipora capricornis]|uniref:low-density lipoprotein receptor-related protein 4-like isoform X1 n=1 Tax=Montipora capricornis TaxID=246305 RepID=UPI0035F1112B